MPDGLWLHWLPLAARPQAIACCVQHHVLCRLTCEVYVKSFGPSLLFGPSLHRGAPAAFHL